jgi:hypothetical protein
MSKDNIGSMGTVLKDKPTINMYKDVVLHMDRSLADHKHIISMMGTHTRSGKLVVIHQWTLDTIDVVDTNRIQLTAEGMVVGMMEKGDE